MQDTNVFITYCALILGASQLIFAFNFLWSLRAGKKALANPWNANSLEWSAPSPPPHGNWGGVTPAVYRGPYEYSSPETDADYLMQTDAPATAAPIPVHR
jgi:cytochrome c oxidase subunit 1